MRHLSLLLLPVLGCAPTEIEVRDRLLTTTSSVGVDTTKLCSGEPLGAGTVDFGKDLKEAGIDLSQGCIKQGTFELAAEFGDITAGETCTVPTGTLTLTGVNVEATCSMGLGTQRLRSTCTSNRLEVADGAQVFLALNACLDELEKSQVEPFRRLINTCKPTTLKFTVEGTCSADLCFKANIKYGVQTKNVVAQLGGTCP